MIALIFQVPLVALGAISIFNGVDLHKKFLNYFLWVQYFGSGSSFLI